MCLDYRSFFWRLSSTIDVILSDIANVLHIWSTLCGFEELAGEFEPIRNRKIFWMKDKELILWLLVQHTHLCLFLKVQSHKWRWSWKATVFSSLLTKRGNFCSLRYLTKQLEWKDSNQEMHVSRLSDVINTRWNVTIRSSYPSDRKASSSTSEFTTDSDRKTVSKAKIRYGFSMLCDKDGSTCLN